MAQQTGNSNANLDGDKNRKTDISTQIWIAIISGIVTITVALLGSPVLERLFPPSTPSPMPSPTAVFTFTSTETITPAPIVFPDTPTVEVATDTPPAVNPLPTAMPTSANNMIVRLAADKTIGKSPLTVKFDATSSFVQASNGQTFACKNGACRYSWEIYLGAKEVTKSDTTKSGTFEYRFQTKGTYAITVHICHGASDPTCGDGSILVIVS